MILTSNFSVQSCSQQLCYF